MASAVPTWRLADLVDYECFLEDDEGESAEKLRDRDRAIFARAIEPKKAGNPRDTLRLWLEERRRVAHSARTRREVVLPGEAFAQTRGLLAGALGVFGALLGGGAAWSALTYARGGEPINALAFFCEFALLQIVILLTALCALGLRKFLPELPSLARLLWRLAAAWAGQLWRRAGARLTTGGARAEARAAFGALRARRGLYGAIVGWNLLRLTQIFAIFFNLGVLGATTARLSLQQLYFGWEATFPAVNAANVHRLVVTAALPWSRLGAAPSREAVERSQNFRRAGEQPDPASSPAWGAFLLAAVTCYGLLPRAALFGWAWFAERRALGQLRFGDARSEALLQRLHTPRMTVASARSNAVAARPPVSMTTALAS